MRRQQVQQRHLLAPPISFSDLLSGTSVPGFDGIQLFGGARDPWGYDDSSNYLKHALCQIEVDRQQAITARVDRDGQIQPGTLVDPWKPLRELVSNLLPHLEFVRIDATDRNQVKVTWRVHGLDPLIDLDELSSGEKSIIQMFYPLVEKQIKALVKEIDTAPESIERPDLCVLIDEPELHLHPNLQVKVLDYLRVLTTGSATQVILATHSPTIVESASFEELFLLRPVDLVQAGENQLVQVASDDERLTFLRDVFGSTANLTALQPVVLVEGVTEQESTRVVADRKLYRALHPGFDRVTLIAGGGKSECKALLRVLNDALQQFSSRLTTVALLDRDTDPVEAHAQIKLLPVSMIENFLLDPDALWDAMQSVIERTSMATVDDVSATLDSVISRLTDAEIGRRTARQLGSSHFHPPSSVEEIAAEAERFIADATTRYSPGAIQSALDAATLRVAELKATNRRREEFHGKSVLLAFYQAHLAGTALAKGVFTFEAARHARRRRAVTSFFDDFFDYLSGARASSQVS
jgi:hypothetical protein